MKSARTFLLCGDPGLPAVVGAVAAAGGDGYVHAIQVCRVRQDRVQAQSARPRVPGSPVRVVVQAVIHRPGLAPVVRDEQCGWLGSRVKHAWLVLAPGGDIPHLYQRLRFLLNLSLPAGSTFRLVGGAWRPPGFGRARDGRHLSCLRPGLAHVIRILRGGAVDEMAHRRVQPPIPWVTLHKHHPPAFKEDIAVRPFFAGSIAAEDETTLGRSDQNDNFLAHTRLRFYR